MLHPRLGFEQIYMTEVTQDTQLLIAAEIVKALAPQNQKMTAEVTTSREQVEILLHLIKDKF